MKEKDLGLPLEYQHMPEYFDAHNIGDDTEAKNTVVEKILKYHKCKTVLDLTCGTGCQVFFLAQRGYKVTGADFSPGLLEIARKKAADAGLAVEFIDGDMRHLQVGTFDAAITMFNAIGHLTKEDFAVAIRNIQSNLKDGGIYVFDIFNLQAMTDAVVSNLAMDLKKTVGGTAIHNKQHSTLDRASSRLTSHDEYTIIKKGSAPEQLQNTFTLQIYTATEIKEILAANGFEVVAQYGMDGLEFIEDQTLSILTVARKL